MANSERRSAQAPSAVIMIRPHQFWPNEETADDNAFQLKTDIDRDTVAKAAFDEVSHAAQTLEEHGIKTHIFCMFGYPGTTMNDAFSTIEFAMDNSNLIDTLDIAPFTLTRHILSKTGSTFVFQTALYTRIMNP